MLKLVGLLRGIGQDLIKEDKFPIISVSQVTGFSRCSLRAIISSLSFSKYIHSDKSMSLSRGTLGHGLIHNLPMYWNFLIENEKKIFKDLNDYIKLFEIKDLEDDKNPLRTNKAFDTVWNWTIEDIKKNPHRRDDYQNILGRYDDLYKEMQKILLTFVKKYPRATKPFIFDEQLFKWQFLGGRLDRFYNDLTLVDYKFSTRGLAKNREWNKYNFGGYTKLLLENGYKVLKAEIVLPKKTKCDHASFNLIELKELKEKFTDMYIKLRNRMRDFIKYGEFELFPKCDPKECGHCFVDNACRQIHIEDQGEEEPNYHVGVR